MEGEPAGSWVRLLSGTRAEVLVLRLHRLPPWRVALACLSGSNPVMTQRLWGFDSLTLRHRCRADREQRACKAREAGQYRSSVHFALDKHTLGG